MKVIQKNYCLWAARGRPPALGAGIDTKTLLKRHSIMKKNKKENNSKRNVYRELMVWVA